MKIKERRILHASDLRTLCIRENWFTLGDNEAYDRMMTRTFCENLTTAIIEDIARDILGNSETDMALPEVMYAVAAISHTTFAEDEDAPVQEMSDREILSSAYDGMLEKWSREWDRLQAQKQAGKENRITAERVERLDRKLDYIRSLIIEIDSHA
jgi:hypothetical protein